MVSGVGASSVSAQTSVWFRGVWIDTLPSHMWPFTTEGRESRGKPRSRGGRRSFFLLKAKEDKDGSGIVGKSKRVRNRKGLRGGRVIGSVEGEALRGGWTISRRGDCEVCNSLNLCPISTSGMVALCVGCRETGLRLADDAVVKLRLVRRLLIFFGIEDVLPSVRVESKL